MSSANSLPRPQTAHQSTSRNTPSRDDAFTTGAFSVGAFSSSIRSDTAPTGRDAAPRSAGERPRSTRTAADRVSRTDSPSRDNRSAAGAEGRRRRQRGAESGRPAAQNPSRANTGRQNPPRQPAPARQAPARQAPAAATAFPVAAHRVPSTPGQPSASFAELGVPAPLLPVLTTLGAVSPFPIQEATLPHTLEGRDVLGRGKTGSGKTIAFAIPLVTRLTGGRRVAGKPRGLILLPTRELALQVARTVEPLAKAAGLRTVVIFGGVGYGNQTAALRSGVDIVIACPGRLEDLVNQKACDLSTVEVTVLDEADHMADLGFLPVVRRLLRTTPARGQRLLFSATLDNGISVLVKEFLTDPILHAVDDETSPVEAMEHHVFAVSTENRPQVIRELAQGGGRRMLFTRTKHSAKKWAAALTKQGIPAVDLHGNLSQNARERNLAAFSSGSAKVLVATDIAARGIHVDDVELVVHLDPPTEHKAYLHRSGRTARAGAGGTVVTVMLPDQAADLRKLMKLAGITPSTTQVAPGHPAIARVAG
jgi:superfamily II DNA/RNA helicase